MMKAVVRTVAWAHRWAGFALAFLFLITLASGIWTGTARLIDRYTTDYGQIYLPQTLADQAAALREMTQRYPNATAYVMPTPSQPFYQATSRRNTTHVAIGTFAELSNERSSAGPIERYMLSLHRNFARGRADRWMVAWLSLAAVGIAIGGLIAAYPFLRRLRRKDLVPKRIDRPYLYRSHLTIGLIALPIIIVMGLTGAAVTYATEARQLLGAENRHVTEKFDEANYDADPTWLGVLTFAQDALDGADLVSVTKPRTVDGESIVGQAYELRFAARGDWHPSGASYVLVDDATWGVLAINRFAEKHFGQKLSEMMRSIHDGRAMPNWYVIVLLMLNAVIVVVVLLGLFSFFQRVQSLPRLPRPLVSRRRSDP